MALVTVNNVAVLSGTIMMPLVGVWTADLVIDQPDGTGFDPGTQVSIACAGGVTLTGVVSPDRSGDFLDAVHVRVLGGAGGMSKDASPTCYVQPQAFVRDVVNGLMSDSGETLSTSADAGFLGTNLTAWSVVQVPCSQALKTLINILQPTFNWRILSDGTLWIGAESWPDTTLTYDLIEANPAMGSYELGFESPSVTPGINLVGVGQVNRVLHTIEPKKIRSHVWVNLPNSDTDRGIRGSIESMVKSAVAGIDYFTKYDAQVMSQSADLKTVDLQPADPRLPGYGSVPLRLGLPGCKVQFSSGAFVRLGWDRGDPSKPYACLFNGGETVQSIQLGGNTPVSRQGDHSNAGTLTLTLTGTTALSGTYVDPDGTTTPVTSGVAITLKAKLSEGSSIVGAG